MSHEDYVYRFLDESKAVTEKLKEQEPQISKTVDILFDAWLNNRWGFLMGNGGSASTATHFGLKRVAGLIVAVFAVVLLTSD